MKAISSTKLSYSVMSGDIFLTLKWNTDIKLIEILHNKIYYTTIDFEVYLYNIKYICENYDNPASRSILLWLMCIKNII